MKACTCQHNVDGHVLVNTTGDPMEGGIFLCMKPGCECWGTWAVGAGEPAYVPPVDKHEAYRRQLRGTGRLSSLR